MVNLCYCIFCIGADLRKVNCLCIIIDFCVNAYFLTFSVQSFKSNQQGIFKCRSVKLKGYIDCSLLCLCGKRTLCCYFLTIYRDGLSCCLVHKNTLYGVLSVNFKSLIGNGINDCYVFLRLGYMILCISTDCCSTYLRDINCLILIGDIGMDCNLNTLIGQILVNNNCSSFQNGCIECKDYFYTFFCLLSGKCSA